MMGWWFDLFGPFAWLLMIIGMVIYFLVSLIIAYYVHRDAIRRGIKNNEIWLLIGLIFNVLGLLLYLLVRGNYRDRPDRTTPEN
ncbi:hypothetical protein LCGC14_0576620 [marine sediment metagenome]|uniref:Cardiolipin synthase N-terminal domain-containing protein n=1 Tax=marine sediment metagenome TaxID=412755 RepID=A0A0F9UQZ7_9ZZZZ|nr:MAG: hypothetical protein Lokiarch_01900 [Candidatus Lokiarchaeum sp. GC14_75]